MARRTTFSGFFSCKENLAMRQNNEILRPAGAVFIFIIAHNYLYFVAFAFDNWKINSKSQRVPALLCDLK